MLLGTSGKSYHWNINIPEQLLLRSRWKVIMTQDVPISPFLRDLELGIKIVDHTFLSDWNNEIKTWEVSIEQIPFVPWERKQWKYSFIKETKAKQEFRKEQGGRENLLAPIA